MAAMAATVEMAETQAEAMAEATAEAMAEVEVVQCPRSHWSDLHVRHDM